MASTFQWHESGLKDTGVASQMGIRTAQGAVNDIMDISQSFQRDANAVQAKNFQTQGKLNNVELVNRIKGFTSVEDLTQAETEGDLSLRSRTDEFGINYDEAKTQQAIDNQKTELVTRELEAIKNIPQTEAEMLETGVGGFNARKSQILDYAQSSSQRAALNTLVDSQLESVMVKQNKLIIDDAVAKFGGVRDLDDPQHNVGIEYAVNQAEKAGYTKAQIDRIKKEYNEAELISNELEGSQTIRYASATAEQAAKESAANAHIAQKLEANAVEVDRALKAYNAIDLQDDTRTNDEIANAYAKGDNVKSEHYSNVFSTIQTYGARLKDEKGNTVPASPGRIKAIFAAVLDAGIDVTNSDAVEKAVIHQIERNNANLANFKSSHLKAVTQRDALLKAQLAIRNEGRSFGIKVKQAIKGGKAIPQTAYLDNYLNALGLATGNAREVVNQELGSTETVEPKKEDKQVLIQQHYQKEQQQLDDNFSATEQETMIEEGNALVSDPGYSFLATEMHGTNPTFGNLQFAEQNAEMENAGVDTSFVLPSAKISAGNYAEQGESYVNRYNRLGTGKPVSTAAGPLQLVSTNVTKAIDAGVINADDPMDVTTQAKVATWLMTENPDIVRYLTTVDSTGTVSGDRAISENALTAFGNEWLGIQSNPEVGKQSLVALRKQVQPVIARAKAQGKPVTQELLMEALMPKGLQRLKVAQERKDTKRRVYEGLTNGPLGKVSR